MKDNEVLTHIEKLLETIVSRTKHTTDLYWEGQHDLACTVLEFLRVGRLYDPNADLSLDWDYGDEPF